MLFVAVVRVEGTGVGVPRPCPTDVVDVGVVDGSEILSFEPASGEEIDTLAACFVFDQVRLRRDFFRLSRWVFGWVRVESMLRLDVRSFSFCLLCG